MHMKIDFQNKIDIECQKKVWQVFSFLSHSLILSSSLHSYLLVSSSYLLLYFWCDCVKCTPFKLIILFVNSMSQFNEIVLVVVIESIAATVFGAPMPVCLVKYFYWRKKIDSLFRWFLPPLLCMVSLSSICWFYFENDDSNVFYDEYMHYIWIGCLKIHLLHSRRKKTLEICL